MLAFIGFLMIAIIIYSLMESKVTPAPVFVITPIVAAFAAGFSYPEVARTAAITKMDITALWHSLIPLQVIGLLQANRTAFYIQSNKSFFRGAGGGELAEK